MATETKWPPCWIYYASIAYIPAKTRSLSLIKDYLSSISDCNVSCTVYGRQGPR